jgi:hypothetical protein
MISRPFDRPRPEFCRHGNKPEDCNDCMIASDFAYDAAHGH